MKTLKSTLSSFSLLFILFCGIFSIAYSSSSSSSLKERSLYDFKTPKHILVLHSYHHGMQWADNITEGINSLLNAPSYGKVYLQFEYMDTKHVEYTPARKAELFVRYKKEFADNKRKFDAIISVDDNALDFLLAYRDRLFPDTPIVFCGVNFLDKPRLSNVKNITGVVESFDIKETLNLAMRLHPGAKEVFIINDFTPTGIANRKALDQLSPLYENRLKFNYSSKVSMKELLKQMKDLPTNSFILLLTFSRDRLGDVYSYRESVEEITSHNALPVYGIWDFYLGRGIVGGKLTSGFHQGDMAARLVAKILTGKKPENLPIETNSPNRFMFDFRQIMRFNIPVMKLPAESIIISRPLNFFDRYRTIIILSAIILSIMLCLILYLFIKHQKAQNAFLESEKRFNSMADLSSEGIVLHENFIIKEANLRFAEMTGYALGELIQKNALDIITEEYIPLVKSTVNSSTESHIEFLAKRKDGSTFWASSTGRNIIYKGKNIRVVTIRDITDEKRSKEARKRWFKFEKTVSTFLSRFVNVEDMNLVINLSLKDLGEFSRADRVYLFLYTVDGNFMNNTHEWCAQGITPQIDNLKDIPKDSTPWWTNQIENNRIIHIDDMSLLPPEAEATREILAEQDIKSLVVIPLYNNDRAIGFIGFDNTREPGEWAEDSIALLRLFAEVLTKVISRQKP